MPRIPSRDAAVLLLTLICGITILVLAVPRAVVAVINLPGNVWLARIQERDDVAVEQLQVLIDSRRAALVWTDSARLRNDLALASLWHTVETQDLNNIEDDSGENRIVLQPAIDLIHESLRIGPANPYAWHQLALAELYAGGVSPAVTRAIEMSIRTGPNEPRIRTARIDLALVTWSALDDRQRALVEDQIRIAWTGPQREVVRIAHDVDRADVVRGALAGSRDDLIEFEENYEHFVRKALREEAEDRAAEAAAQAGAEPAAEAPETAPQPRAE